MAGLSFLRVVDNATMVEQEREDERRPEGCSGTIDGALAELEAGPIELRVAADLRSTESTVLTGAL